MTSPIIARVSDPVPGAAPTNPYMLKAIALRDAGDTDGLVALDAYLAEAGYAADGKVRAFIAQALQPEVDP